MMDMMQVMTTFFGWVTVINIAIYLIIVIAVMSMRDFVTKLNAKLFGLSEEHVARATFRYIANYKLLMTIFCLVPWLALKLMG